MAAVIIDYQFNKPSVANADGSFAASFTGATVVPGPGTTDLGNLPNALDLGTAGSGLAKLTGLKPDSQQFCIEILFRAKGPVTARETLAESDLLLFALVADKGNTAGDFVLTGNVGTAAQGADGPSTRFHTTLSTGRWYRATLAYDQDTAALFIDGQLVSVHAFPDGRLKQAADGSVYFGNSKSGGAHLVGELAAFRWYNGIPEELEARLDERRSHPEWFVTYKYESPGSKAALGQPIAALAYDAAADAHLQQYERGAIMYHDSVGAAFALKGALHAAYQALPNRAQQLGYLVSDESSTTRAGGRKSVFSRGAIYWSQQTGAVPVFGEIYIAYEDIGESAAVGFPKKPALAIASGLEQEFELARFYYRSGDPKAHAVRGAMLDKLLASGGVAQWGYPTSNESDVNSGGAVIGKFSDLEHGTIYWSSRTGAHITRGDIGTKYRDLRGPLGWLGFPTSDQVAIPGYAGASGMNTFEHGSILWYGNANSTVVAGPFKVYIGRINSKESEGWLMGQNDLYCYVKLQDGSQMVYDKRQPGSGDWSGNNIKDMNLTIPVSITPNDPNKVVTYSVDVWEADPGDDDHLGKYTKVLNAANAWGLREGNGVFNSGSFSKINSITSSIKPDIDPRSLTETEKFWGVRNQGTPTISWQQYASAFRDVDSDTEWWDVTDWLDKAFYELVVDSLAGGGNCFGMSLEAIYARKGSSPFGLPINRFNTWETVRNEFNIKHCYQVGAGPIWWFLDQFVTGNTHDPKDVFNNTRREFDRGSNPVLCLSQNYDFSGAPHCILPVAWDSSSKPWRITICDPNFPNQLKQLTVNPDDNSFDYPGASHYQGGNWSGGRLHYMPFSLLNGRPRTPVWDAILLLLSGTILILADDAETVAITDTNGNDLDAFGGRANQMLQSGQHIDDFFVGFKGYNVSPIAGDPIAADPVVTGPVMPGPIVRPLPNVPVPPHVRPRGPVAGEVLLRSQKATAGRIGLPHLPLGDLLADRRLRALSSALDTQPQLRQALAGRTVQHMVNDPQTMASLPQPIAQQLQGIAQIGAPLNFVHQVRARRDGQLQYVVKHQLTEIKLGSTLKAAETHKMQVSDLGSSKNTLKIDSASNKLFTLEVSNKLGVGKDYVRINVSNIPVGPGQALSLSLKPGLGGLDLVGIPGAANAIVTVDAVVGAKPFRSQFNVPIDGGVRIKPASILSENALTFSRIDRLFGRPLATGRVGPQP